MGYYNAIHEEAAEVFQNEEDWDKLASINKLTRIDSAIRESMRLNPSFGRVAMHEVLSKTGITLPNGPHVPRGAWLGITVTGIHLDERYYPRAHTYDPFRFSRGRAEIAKMEETQKTESTKAACEKTRENDEPSTTEAAISEKPADSSKAVESKPNGALLSTSQEEFPAFGFGRHSWYVSLYIYIYIFLQVDYLAFPPCLANINDYSVARVDGLQLTS